MKKILLGLLFTTVSLFSYAEYDTSVMWNPQGLPVDEARGPWFATIDLEATEWAWQRQQDLVRKGDTALRFELRDGDCFTAEPNAPETGWDDCTRDRERSEIREKWYAPLNRDVWYSFSVFIPSDYTWMYPKQIFFQWHGGDWGPNVYFQLKRDQFLIDILTEEHQTTTQYDMGTLERGMWHDFTVNAQWSKANDGKLVVYRNKDLVLEHYGPTMDKKTYDIGKGPYVKMGIYRSHLFRWTSEEPHPTQILYFDEYRRGYTYSDVAIDSHAGD